MWLDELTLSVEGGAGGDGAVHFARRKYEPFAGPDGGDGGKGGNVVLVGRRDLDSLYHLRTVSAKASNGAPGGPNLMIGANAPEYELAVPLGTIAYDANAGFEYGVVVTSGERLAVALGGKGGKGNPHYATGRRRAPKMFEKGWPGDTRELLLRYRIFCDTALIEPSGTGVVTADQHRLLLPQLLKRDPRDVDYDLYRRKPRWVRIGTDYHQYDAAYLPVLLDQSSGTVEAHLEHAYWAQALIVNLAPLAPDEVGPWWCAVLAQLETQPWRRLASCTCIVPANGDDGDWPALVGGAPLAVLQTTTAADLVEMLEPLLTGGPVV